MQPQTRFLSQHRFARITLWARAMLAWIAVVLFAEGQTPRRRHIRQRYRLASLDWAERLVRALAIIRAAEIAGLRKRVRRILRNAAPAGFHRRTQRAGLMRATAGSRFRRALKHGDPTRRIQLLLTALADIDAFARRFLLPRAKRRLTKLCAVILVAPPADLALALAAPAPRAADSS